MEENKIPEEEIAPTETARPQEQKERCLSRAFVGYWHYGVILTYLAVALSVVGICFSASGKAGYAVVCLLLAGLCDTFDGVVARTRKNRSDGDKSYGIQIDSLCDLVSFGVAPVMIGYAMGMRRWYYIAVFVAYVLSAVIRLAYFNVTEIVRTAGQSGRREAFEGIPVTQVSMSLPVFYLVATMFKRPLFGYLVMLIPYCLGAVLMIARIKVAKPRLKKIIVILILMIALIVGLFLLRWHVFNIHRL